MKSRRFSLPMSLVFCLSLFSVSVLTKTGTAQVPEAVEINFPQETVKVRKVGKQYFLICKEEVDRQFMKDIGYQGWMYSNSVKGLPEEQTQSFFQVELK